MHLPPPQTAALHYHYEQEFHSQLYTVCIYQLEQVQTYLIHEK